MVRTYVLLSPSVGAPLHRHANNRYEHSDVWMKLQYEHSDVSMNYNNNCSAEYVALFHHVERNAKYRSDGGFRNPCYPFLLAPTERGG